MFCNVCVITGVYESELERIGNVYMLRDEAPHRLQTVKTDSIMATGVVGFRSIENVARILQVSQFSHHSLQDGNITL